VRNHDDARDVFKMLKSQHIGERHAGMYYEWAALEAAGGSQFKALGVLAKGLKEQAQPARSAWGAFVCFACNRAGCVGGRLCGSLGASAPMHPH
jgi:hypothetical protein